MSKNHRTCPECGARITEGAVRCNLCGSPVEETAIDETVAATPNDESQARDATAEEAVAAAPRVSAAAPEETTPPEVSAVDPADQPVLPDGIYCNQCGWKNPGDARFCSRCGTRLQKIRVAASTPSVPQATAPASPRPVPKTPPEAHQPVASPSGGDHHVISRQVGIIIGAGVMLVIALFLVTAVSKTRMVDSTPSASPAAQTASPTPSADLDEGPALPSQLSEQVKALEAEMEQLEGPERVAKHRDLVALFFGAGRLDKAAFEQQKIAETTDESDDWKRAGDLYYDWMDTIKEAPRKAQIADQAIAAYQHVLDADPDNLDVRTDMATAYLSSSNPMQGVTEIKKVLDVDPDHLHARFNYGIMLAMIGRSSLAVEQFEYVKKLVDANSTYYRQADEAIRTIQSGGRVGS